MLVLFAENVLIAVRNLQILKQNDWQNTARTPDDIP